jgi:hypothetical protein
VHHYELATKCQSKEYHHKETHTKVQRKKFLKVEFGVQILEQHLKQTCLAKLQIHNTA